jgi:hypothetical protein
MGEGHAGDLLQGFVTCIGEHAEEEDYNPSDSECSHLCKKQGLGLGVRSGKIIPEQEPMHHHSSNRRGYMRGSRYAAVGNG